MRRSYEVALVRLHEACNCLYVKIIHSISNCCFSNKCINFRFCSVVLFPVIFISRGFIWLIEDPPPPQIHKCPKNLIAQLLDCFTLGSNLHFKPKFTSSNFYRTQFSAKLKLDSKFKMYESRFNFKLNILCHVNVNCIGHKDWKRRFSSISWHLHQSSVFCIQ